MMSSTQNNGVSSACTPRLPLCSACACVSQELAITSSKPSSRNTTSAPRNTTNNTQRADAKQFLDQINDVSKQDGELRRRLHDQDSLRTRSGPFVPDYRSPL
eukprot:2060332-Rhodomonas_salina.1